MKLLLYVTNRATGSGMGGREQLSRLHGRILLDLFGDGFGCIELADHPGFRKLFGYLDGVSRSSIAVVCDRIRESGAQQVFLDGSNLGKLAQGIKRSIPSVQVVTFFHNCEARFFLGALKRSWSLKALAVLLSNYLAERSALRYSDKRICLSQRDSLLLKRIYGESATHVAPMAMEDKAPSSLTILTHDPHQPMMLFVGGTFYANEVGIAWFVKYVVPRIDVPLCIVGKGFEYCRDALEVDGRVTVVGTVADLSKWYSKSSFVVAPIFDGSGMKTKVAEALMFGKRVIGTPEAFSGYEDIVGVGGEVCVDADEFVEAIKREVARPSKGFDPRLRAIYENRYSLHAAKLRLSNILALTR